VVEGSPEWSERCVGPTWSSRRSKQGRSGPKVGRRRGGDLAWHSGPRFDVASLGDEVHAGSDEGSARSGSSSTRVWRFRVRAREWRGGEVVGNFLDRGTRGDKAGHVAGRQKSVGAVRTVGDGGQRTWWGQTRRCRRRRWSGGNSGRARSEDAVVADKWAIGPF
jgi:hypothetical protein